jgi:signal transduction histidine kinase
VREAITNVGRHAQASTVRVTVEATDGFLLEIADDGCGFDPSQNGGFGLTGMKERAESVGGTFELDTSPGAGTRIRVRDAVREMP